MPRRALHWLVLCFATVWFGVLVPVHNRGEIRLPGAATSEAKPAPAPAGHCHATAPSEGRPPCHDPAGESGGSCAVCYFIAGLDAPPPVTLIEARLGLVGRNDAAPPRGLVAARLGLPFHSRGPPAA